MIEYDVRGMCDALNNRLNYAQAFDSINLTMEVLADEVSITITQHERTILKEKNGSTSFDIVPVSSLNGYVPLPFILYLDAVSDYSQDGVADMAEAICEYLESNMRMIIEEVPRASQLTEFLLSENKFLREYAKGELNGNKIQEK